MDDIPPPIPLSQSENWKQIAADGEKKYRDELIRWSKEKTRSLAVIQRLSAENERLKGENERLKGENERLKGAGVTKTTKRLKF